MQIYGFSESQSLRWYRHEQPRGPSEIQDLRQAACTIWSLASNRLYILINTLSCDRRVTLHKTMESQTQAKQLHCVDFGQKGIMTVTKNVSI